MSQPQRAGLLHEQLARCLRMLGDPEALGEQQQAVRLVPPEPSSERARVLSLARPEPPRNAVPLSRGQGLAEEAIAIARQVGARGDNAVQALGGALVYLGDADAGLAEFEVARRLASQAGDVIGLLRAIVNRSDALLAAGRFGRGGHRRPGRH